MINLKNCSVEKFMSYAKDKRVFAFGAGKLIRLLCKKRPQLRFEKVIFSFTDNDTNKWGKDYIVNESVIPIISVNDFTNSINKNDIILISSIYYPSIVEKLDNIETLDCIDCFLLPFLEEYRFIDSHLKDKIAAVKEKEPQIPKVIHYCWFGENQIPDNLKKYMESWNKFCPHYEIIRWDESNYDLTKHEYVNRAWKAKKWSRVSNYTRLDIVYENGGIYLDNDIELIKPLDDLMYHQAFMAFEAGGYINTGSGFGAKKHCDIIRILRDDYNNRDFSIDLQDMGAATSPIYQSDVLKKQGFKLDNTFQSINGLAIYPQEFFSPLSCNTKILNITKNSYSIHHYDGSWISNNVKMTKIADDYNARMVEI